MSVLNAVTWTMAVVWWYSRTGSVKAASYKKKSSFGRFPLR